MDITDLVSLILPKEVSDNFELTRIEKSTTERLDIYLDELSVLPEGEGIYVSKGFTPCSTVQDYPLRGRAVYLHIRRRKWQEQSTGAIVIRSFDITHEGTRISKEFAAFLKEAHR